VECVVALPVVAVMLFMMGRQLTFLSEAPATFRRWAEEAGYRVVAMDHRWLSKGPFSFWTGNDRGVYRITVEDGRGIARSGWAKVGSPFWIDPHRVEVVWDTPEGHEPRPWRMTPESSPLWDRDLDA